MRWKQSAPGVASRVVWKQSPARARRHATAPELPTIHGFPSQRGLTAAARGQCLRRAEVRWALQAAPEASSRAVHLRARCWRRAKRQHRGDSGRPAVLWRKGSFGTDGEAGSRFVERVLMPSPRCACRSATCSTTSRKPAKRRRPGKRRGRCWYVDSVRRAEPPRGLMASAS